MTEQNLVVERASKQQGVIMRSPKRFTVLSAMKKADTPWFPPLAHPLHELLEIDRRPLK